jgi:hypothetical protein
MMILLHGSVAMTTVVLNVKIDAELKEKLRHYAEVNNENLGTATESCCSWLFSWRRQQMRRG